MGVHWLCQWSAFLPCGAHPPENEAVTRRAQRRQEVSVTSCKRVSPHLPDASPTITATGAGLTALLVEASLSAGISPPDSAAAVQSYEDSSSVVPSLCDPALQRMCFRERNRRERINIVFLKHEKASRALAPPGEVTVGFFLPRSNQENFHQDVKQLPSPSADPDRAGRVHPHPPSPNQK